jgi:hypothetical protein
MKQLRKGNNQKFWEVQDRFPLSTFFIFAIINPQGEQNGYY